VQQILAVEPLRVAVDEELVLSMPPDRTATRTQAIGDHRLHAVIGKTAAVAADRALARMAPVEDAHDVGEVASGACARNHGGWQESLDAVT
jgi:hypothetical protein